MNIAFDALAQVFDAAEQRMPQPRIVQEPCPNPSCERGKVFVRRGEFYEATPCRTCNAAGYILCEAA